MRRHRHRNRTAARPRSSIADFDLSLDLHDYLNNSPPPLPSRPSKLVSLTVTDDWPRVVPIGVREIEVTETHLERVLAELLGPLP